MAAMSASLKGKTYIVTGSTDGIGQHTAISLAKTGGNIIVHGRSKERVEASAERVRQAASGGWVKSYLADLSSLQSVRQFAEALRRDHDSFDVLINNAGVFEPKYHKSADGFEMTWAVNVLAPFLLTSLLMDRVTERIVIVSSMSAGSHIDFDNLNQEKGYSSHDAYSLSKLAEMVITSRLAGKIGASGPTVNCLDPGNISTKMLRTGWGMSGTPLHQANGVIKLAADPSLSKVTGKYYMYDEPSSMPQEANDPKIQQRLWDVLEKQTGARWPANIA
ncbi:hypothetical protein WJX84_010099 [Apatococcus fuscideae]|uniref:Uncharacterized protein n=1 Tax=Apatococcus fuscideae TaxID=2026836 RepID=A0AAW1SW00_9CHLO